MDKLKTKSGKLILVLIVFGFMSFSHLSDGKIKGWILAGSAPDHYEIGIESNAEREGNVAYLKSIAEDIEGFGTIMQSFEPVESIAEDIEGFGTIMQSFEPVDYLGKKVKLTGKIKTIDIDEWCAMWMRIDGIKEGKHETLEFDNMQDRPIKGTKDWSNYEIILEVPKEAKSISYGVLIGGTGKALIDNFKFEIIDNKTESTGNLVKLRRPTNTSFDESIN